jgi:hypothetical protein
MLLAYDTEGAVVWTSGTNTAHPEGPPLELVPTLTGRSDLLTLVLHDVEDAELVQATFTHQVSVIDGELVVGDKLPEPEPPPAPAEPVTREEFDGLMTMFLESM